MKPQQCAICGAIKPNSLEVHHVVPRELNGSDEPENLVTLCASCHAAVTKIYDDSFYKRIEERICNGPHSAVSKFNQDGKQTVSASGIKLDSYNSKDKQLPQNAIHVRYSRWHPEKDELVDQWMLNKSEVSVDSLDDVTTSIVKELPPNDPVKAWAHYEREPKIIHCAYCDTAFLPWQHGQAAKHLRIYHGIENPYEEKEYVGEI